MYKNGFVLSVKNKGKILRDRGKRVEIPFYEEYSLLLKNDNNRKAVAKITIDGENIAKGSKFIVPSNGSINIERYVKNLDKGRKFQFVPNGDSRIGYKKESGELGIIEVEFQLEKERNLLIPNYPWNWESTDMLDCYYRPTINFKASAQSASNIRPQSVTSFNRSGGTAHGSRSTQKFNEGYTEDLETSSTTIRLRLVPSDEPLTVDESRNVYCNDCGKKNHGNSNYCSRCGKSLNK